MSTTEIQISASALKHNFKRLRELSGDKALFPVIKANAYGHGLTEIGKFFDTEFSEEQLPFLCVARFNEAEKLRKAKIQRKLLVLSEYSLEEVSSNSHVGIEYVVSRLEDFDILLQAPSYESGFHLNINTGMNRLGFDFRRLDQWMDSLSLKILALVAKGWKWSGIMTHLARGEEDPELFSHVQTERFHAALSMMKVKLVPRGLSWPQWIHISNSGGLLRGVGKDPLINACRPGIHLWGAYADMKDQASFDFKPALTCFGEVRQLRQIPQGEGMGYGHKFISTKNRLIGTVNLGYADGIPRILSRAEGSSWKLGLVVEGTRVPFVGVISMDMCMVDLTDHPQASQWMKLDRVPRDLKAYWICAEQRSEEIAEVLGTIPYEVFCSLSARLRRQVGESQ